MSLKSIVFFAAMLGVTGAQAHPKIYTYLDADGVRHFTDVPDDNRYRLLLISPQEMTESGDRYDAALLARATQYDAIIEKAASSNAVEANLLRAVIVVESGFNSRAVSKRGAVGLMQLMPATASPHASHALLSTSRKNTPSAVWINGCAARILPSSGSGLPDPSRIAAPATR